MAPASTQSTIVQLPTGHPDKHVLHSLALKYRDLRLRALHAEPDAYAQTYEGEAHNPLEHWEQRLTNDFARVFVILSTENTTQQSTTTIGEAIPLEVIKKADWVGSLVLFGPRFLPVGSPDTIEEQLAAADSAFQLFRTLIQPPDLGFLPDSSPASQSSKTSLYFMKDVFIEPSFRGNGLGKKLLMQALDVAGRETRSLGPSANATCVLGVDKSNAAASALYIKTGFDVVVEEPYRRIDGRSEVGVYLCRAIT